MTQENGKEWVPEVGERLRRKIDNTELNVVAIHEGFLWLETNGGMATYSKEDVIPLKTEAEKRCDEQFEFLHQTIRFAGDWYVDPEGLAKYLIDAGWIKPKPLTNSVTEQIIIKYGPLTVYEMAQKIDSYIRGEDP